MVNSLLSLTEQMPTLSEFADRIVNFMTYRDHLPITNHTPNFIIGGVSLLILLCLIFVIIYSPATRFPNDLYDDLTIDPFYTNRPWLENRSFLYPNTLGMLRNSNFDLRHSSGEDIDTFLPVPARNVDTFLPDYTPNDYSVSSTMDELWDYPPPYTPIDDFSSSSFQNDHSSSLLGNWLQVDVQDLRHRNVYLPSYEEAISDTIECEQQYRQVRSYVSCFADSYNDEPPSYEEATSLHNSIAQPPIQNLPNSDQQQSE